MQLDGVFFAKDSVNGHDADMFRFFKATPLIKEKRIAYWLFLESEWESTLSISPALFGGNKNY